MDNTEKDREFPEHIAAIAALIHPDDVLTSFLIPCGLILSYLDGRCDNPQPSLYQLKASLGNENTAVLLEWLGIKIDETPGLEVSISKTTNRNEVENRYRRFEQAL